MFPFSIAVAAIQMRLQEQAARDQLKRTEELKRAIDEFMTVHGAIDVEARWVEEQPELPPPKV